MATFATELIKVKSEPITVVHMEPKQRLISDWTNSSGTIYYIDLDYFVINVLNESVALTNAASASVGSDEWFFNSTTKRLYIDIGEDPSGVFLHVVYRLFFSNRPMDLPYDMATGAEVNYNGLLKSTSSFTDQIDPDDLVGIALSGNGSLKFDNDGSWQSIYSKLFWETSLVKIYLGFTNIATSEYKLIYRGYIDSKSYNISTVDFKLKDFIEKLRSEVPLNLFTSADGDITNEGSVKKRIYGRAKVLGNSLDKIKDGYALTGTFTKTGDRILTGSGSSLITQATPEDKIVMLNSIGEEVDYSIESVDSATQLTTSEELDVLDSGITVTLQPAFNVPYRNRSFFICDHQMKEPATTVVSSNNFRMFTVVSSTDFYTGDSIKVNGELTTIKTVSEDNLIILLTNLSFIPTAGMTVVKQAVYNVWFNENKLVLDRDYSITNASPSKIVIDTDAEFNITRPQTTDALTFTNGSNEVTGSIAFKDFFTPWDYVRSTDITHTTWYQILQVKEDRLILRSNYTGSTDTVAGQRKNVKHIGDDDRILIDCNGITENGVKTGTWIRTASQAVKHILTEQNIDVDSASFTQANLDAPYLLSLTVPLFGENKRPMAREVIDTINKTVLGSLHENSTRDIVYNVLSPKKAVIDTIFRDDDLISYRIESTGKNIAKNIFSRYRHEEANIFSGEKDSLLYERTNEFISKISDIQREIQQDLYLWDETDAQTLTQRISLLREFSNTIIKMNSNSLFLNKSINQLVYLELRDMFERFGTDADKAFIGVINLLTKGNGLSEIEVTDLGGFYNKIATYADSSDSAYGSSDILYRAKNGYYTNSSGIIDSSKQYRLNLYG